jgi:hypothetical protein
VALGPAALVLLVRLFIQLIRISGRRDHGEDDEARVARERGRR